MNDDRIADIIVIFIIVMIFLARICGWITWPWIWMLAPIWIPLGLGTLFSIFVVIVIIIEEIKERQNEFRD